jgi:DNA-binding IscR family transcriptional regulator
VQAVERPAGGVHCILPSLRDEPICGRVDRCAPQLLWSQVSEAVTDVLSAFALNDLCDQATELTE